MIKEIQEDSKDLMHNLLKNIKFYDTLSNILYNLIFYKSKLKTWYYFAIKNFLISIIKLFL